MTDIIHNQRSQAAIEAGTAFRASYAKAKKWKSINWFVAFTLAVAQLSLSILSTLYNGINIKSYEPHIITFLMIYLLVGALARVKCREWQSLGCTIQRKHDSLVLSVGTLPSLKELPESKVKRLSSNWLKKHPNDKAEFTNWWSESIGTVPQPIGSIVSALATFSWECELRKVYNRLLAIIFFSLLGGLVGIAILTNLSTLQTIIITLAPFTPFLALIFDEWQESKSATETGLAIKSDCFATWENAKNRKLIQAEVSEQLNQHFNSWQYYRMATTPIFSWVYRLLRNKMEDDMLLDSQALIKDYAS